MQKLGVFWKIQDICYKMGTEIFKIEEEMTEKLKPKLGNPSLTAHNKYSLIIFTILCCIWVLGLNTSGKDTKLFFLNVWQLLALFSQSVLL